MSDILMTLIMTNRHKELTESLGCILSVFFKYSKYKTHCHFCLIILYYHWATDAAKFEWQNQKLILLPARKKIKSASRCALQVAISSTLSQVTHFFEFLRWKSGFQQAWHSSYQQLAKIKELTKNTIRG